MVAAITADAVAQVAKVVGEDLAIVFRVPSKTSGLTLRIVQMDLSSYIFFQIQRQCQH